MDIATLGLRIINEAAVRALDVTSQKLDKLGEDGERAHARVAQSSQKVTDELIRQQQQVAKLGAQYSQLTSGELSNAVAWFDKMYGPAKKVAEVQGEMGAASGLAVGGIGRLRQSFASLAAQATGTSPMLDRIITTLGAFGAGNVVVIGVLAGITGVAYAIHELSGVSEQSEKALAALRGEIEKDGDALGTLSVKAAAAESALAKHLLGMSGSLKELLSTTNLKALAEGALGFITGGAGGGGAGYFASLGASVGQGAADQTKADQDAQRKRADALSTLIRDNNASKAERARALGDLRKDQAELLALRGKFDDTSVARRLDLSGQVRELTDAFTEKKHATKKPAYLDAITTGSVAVQQSVETSITWYKKEVEEADRAIAARAKFIGGASLKSVPTELLANGSPALKAFDAAVSAARDTQDRITTRNAINAAEGKGPVDEGKGTVMDNLRKSAVQSGAVVIDQLQRMGASGKVLQIVLENINKQLKDIGAIAPKSDQTSLTDKITSGLRTGADAANLFGGPKGGKIANILNTAANAADNVKSAAAEGFHNPIADAQAVLSVASLGKQILGLGSQSHDAARAIQEASESIKSMIATLSASVNHDALGGQLAAAQAADDARKSQINSALSGKKREAERNQQLAADDALFAKQKEQITQQYAIQQTFDKESLAARLDRAKGLSYQADLEDLAVKQQEEMNAAILAGRDAAYLASLAQVQLAEKTQLANQAITQLANAPTGFFAERYFGQFSTPAGFPGITPPTTTGTTGVGATFNAPVNININGANKDPLTIAKETVGEIRKLGSQYGGMGTTVAETMELMPS